MQATESILAVDIGATKAAIALINNQLQIVDRIDVPTGSNISIWADIEVATKNLISQNGLQSESIKALGIASAGPINRNAGTISPVNIPSWRDFPIVKNFAKLLNVKKIQLCGDAIALTFAESKIGTGVGISDFLGMVVSTGIGGGLFINHKIYEGATGNAGYFGHHSINFDSDLCVCGRTGCVELFASGPKMVNAAKKSGWNNQQDTFEALAADARAGNQIAIKSIDEGANALAVGIINVLAILDINSVIVGGGVVNAGAIYWDQLTKHINHEAQRIGFLPKVDLRQSKLNSDAGLIGAALLVMQD